MDVDRFSGRKAFGAIGDPMTDFGLDSRILDMILKVLDRYPSLEKVVIYGSRAKGTFKNSSDIDIAVYAPGMNETDFVKLRFELCELPVVFKIDVVHVEALGDRKLIEKIAKEGRVIFPRNDHDKNPSTKTKSGGFG